MERYTRQGYKFVFQLIYVICMFLLSLYFIWCIIVNFVNASTLIDYLITLLVICFAISIWGSFYVSIRSLLTVIFVDEKGMGIKRFNSIKVYIKYDDIKEIGIGKALTITGEKKKLYFACRSLNNNEKNNLDLIQNEIVYFTNIDDNFKQYIEEHSNLSLIKWKKDVRF